jgi:hypothetical protein
MELFLLIAMNIYLLGVVFAQFRHALDVPPWQVFIWPYTAVVWGVNLFRKPKEQ